MYNKYLYAYIICEVRKYIDMNNYLCARKKNL